MRMLRRATASIAVRIAATVAIALGVVSGLAYTLTIHAQHRAQEETVRRVTLAAGPELAGADGVVLLHRAADGSVTAGVGAPPDFLRLDLADLPPGPGTAGAGDGHLAAYVVDDAAGRTVGILDVSGREEAGERLVASLAIADAAGVLVAAGVGLLVARRAVRPLAAALALQRRFVADASHELRTPLAVLHTRAQLVQRRLRRAGPAVDDRLARDVAQLTADTRALGNIVDDLLLAAELAHRPGTFRAVDASELADEVVTSIEPYAAENGVRLVRDLPADPAPVRGVRTSLRRSLSALLDNAIAHTGPGGTVTIRVRAEGGRVTVAVVDDGDGLDPAQAPLILDRFARGPSQPDRPVRRYGLGLALVNEVVSAHSGRLLVDGRPGEGAAFTLVLPSAAPVPHTARAPDSPTR